MEKEVLFGKTLSELQEVVSSLSLPKYTAGQMAQWLYQKEVTSIDEMTNLSKNARTSLSEKYQVGPEDPVSVQVSSDGTKKYLFKTPEGGYIESAYIPEKKRSTLCVSSQVGCKMRCLFCMTGKQGFQAQLTVGEILNQISRLPERQNLTNLVYMGMGEPMDNLDAVLKSLEILTSDWGYGWSPKKITVSTIGLVPEMHRYLENTDCHLAVSLHSPFEKERRMLMPISQKYSIEDILSALKKHTFDRQRRVSFEYIVFSGQNDTKAHVKELARILNGLKCRVNLIRFHTIPNTPLPGTTEESIQQFKEALLAKGIMTTIRASRGQDIDAACGLLSTREMKNTFQTNTLKISPNQ
ncbi:MAG: 23S rRNA (adenine(2503)-C(2))-methyltransferase RlmN [Bacteroidales bacterium]|nr:23S rRNA (adenine(2503)-C(2))-methyltransferase RlmN [Bacteroidales bacterium]